MNKKEYIKRKGLPIHEGIKNIELVLENCEVITIPREMIKMITIKDFEKTFANRSINYIGLSEIPKYVMIQIKDSSQSLNSNFTPIFEYERSSLLIDRLSDNDITQICINYLWDDEQYHWLVDWDEDSDYTNELQSTFDHRGDIWIAIGEEAQEDLDSYISNDKYDDDDDCDLYDMYSEDEYSCDVN